MQFSGDQLDPNSQLNPKLFSYKGRIGRLRFFVLNLITYIFAIPLHFVLLMLDSYSIPGHENEILLAIMVILFVIWLVADVIAILGWVKRLHDVKKSTGFMFFYFVPLACWILGLYLLFKKSAYSPRGANPQGSSQPGFDYISIKKETAAQGICPKTKNPALNGQSPR